MCVVQQIFCSFIVLNLFTAVVLENFARDNAPDEAQRNLLLGLQRWMESWVQVDPFGVKHLEATLFLEMMGSAPLPLGFGSNSRTRLWILKRLQKFRIRMVSRRCDRNTFRDWMMWVYHHEEAAGCDVYKVATRRELSLLRLLNSDGTRPSIPLRDSNGEWVSDRPSACCWRADSSSEAERQISADSATAARRRSLNRYHMALLNHEVKHVSSSNNWAIKFSTAMHDIARCLASVTAGDDGQTGGMGGGESQQSQEISSHRVLDATRRAASFEEVLQTCEEVDLVHDNSQGLDTDESTSTTSTHDECWFLHHFYAALIIQGFWLHRKPIPASPIPGAIGKRHSHATGNHDEQKVDEEEKE